MADTKTTTPSALPSREPQPGDGAYLARTRGPPQPGDGAYLTQSSGSSSRELPQIRTGGGGGREGQQGKGGLRRGGRRGPNASGHGPSHTQFAGDSNGHSEMTGQPQQIEHAYEVNFAALNIEEVSPPPSTVQKGKNCRSRGDGADRGSRGRHDGYGDGGGPSGGRLRNPLILHDRYSEEAETRKRSANRRSVQRKARQARAAQGHQENVEESRALGLGVVEDGACDGSLTPLNPSAPSFSPSPIISRQISRTSVGDIAEEFGDDGSSPVPTSTDGRKRKAKRKGKENEPSPAPVSSRRAAFDKQTKLSTTASNVEKPDAHRKTRERTMERKDAAEPDDLNSRLTRGLRGKPFLECPICFNAIFAPQQTWSCLPPHDPPKLPEDIEENEKSAFLASYHGACYTPFHIACIRDWATRSLSEDAERLRTLAMEEDPTWRCPGCQKRRSTKVGGYKCFCGRLSNPPTLSSAPHSCNDACARRRANCEHACPLNCHPGPCPPCQVALVVPCPSHHTPLTVKCSVSSSNNAALSPVCDEPCERLLSCAKHACERPCHFGPCSPCDEVETVRCYCGDEEKVVPCGWGKEAEKLCATLDENWSGRFACETRCEKPYDCGIHSCKEMCHPHPLSALPCPTSPSVINTCPCGATTLDRLPGFPRADCLAPIPTCSSPCPKSRPCGHRCPRTCHSGDCPPCHEDIYRPCRCGENMLHLQCDEVRERDLAGEGEFTCERVCKALRNCGRHECSRVCCPLSYKAKRKGRRALEDFDNDDLHACPLICGKLLGCGIHTCPKPDHKGACGRCLQASYEELICYCGHTVIYPPVACGATITCIYPCTRPDPSCGHPKTPHNCHEQAECPPCPYLTSKPCACGKDPAVKNVRCSQSQDRVSCGQSCGKLLQCGFHKCERSCHPGECGTCTQTCNKPKRICQHLCTAACHAPAKCPETDPCTAPVIQSCACGHLQSRTNCGASTANSSSREVVQLKCNSECMVRQRNARLAEALGIKQPVDRSLIEWTPELRTFAEQNSVFLKMVEQTFRDFFASTRQTLILPHMPPAKRQFVMALADVYHLGRELIDAEPNRSVQIRRRVDTRIPSPLLSAAAPPPAQKPLGGLGNLRSGSATVAGAWGRSSSTQSSASSAAAVAAAPIAAPSPWGTSKSAAAPTTMPPPPVPVMTAPSQLLYSQSRGNSRVASRVASPAIRPSGDDDDWDMSGDEV